VQLKGPKRRSSKEKKGRILYLNSPLESVGGLGLPKLVDIKKGLKPRAERDGDPGKEVKEKTP